MWLPSQGALPSTTAPPVTAIPGGAPRSGERPITVAVVDPQPTYAHGLSALLTSVTVDIKVVGVACTSQAADQVMQQRCPEIVVLGVGGAHAEGRALLGVVRRRCSQTRVLVLCAEHPGRQAVDWLRSGVQGFLGKDAEVNLLISTLRVVHTGGVVVARSAWEAALAVGTTPTPALSAQEQELLRLVLEGLTNAEISRRLAVSESTLKRALHRLVHRLHARDRNHAALLAQQQGLL